MRPVDDNDRAAIGSRRVSPLDKSVEVRTHGIVVPVAVKQRDNVPCRPREFRQFAAPFARLPVVAVWTG